MSVPPLSAAHRVVRGVSLVVCVLALIPTALMGLTSAAFYFDNGGADRDISGFADGGALCLVAAAGFVAAIVAILRSMSRD